MPTINENQFFIPIIEFNRPIHKFVIQAVQRFQRI